MPGDKRIPFRDDAAEQIRAGEMMQLISLLKI
jgi:hypothetical protein